MIGLFSYKFIAFSANWTMISNWMKFYTTSKASAINVTMYKLRISTIKATMNEATAIA